MPGLSSDTAGPPWTRAAGGRRHRAICWEAQAPVLAAFGGAEACRASTRERVESRPAESAAASHQDRVAWSHRHIRKAWLSPGVLGLAVHQKRRSFLQSFQPSRCSGRQSSLSVSRGLRCAAEAENHGLALLCYLLGAHCWRNFLS